MQELEAKVAALQAELQKAPAGTAEGNGAHAERLVDLEQQLQAVGARADEAELKLAMLDSQAAQGREEAGAQLQAALDRAAGAEERAVTLSGELQAAREALQAAQMQAQVQAQAQGVADDVQSAGKLVEAEARAREAESLCAALASQLQEAKEAGAAAAAARDDVAARLAEVEAKAAGVEGRAVQLAAQLQEAVDRAAAASGADSAAGERLAEAEAQLVELKRSLSDAEARVRDVQVRTGWVAHVIGVSATLVIDGAATAL